MIYGVAAAETLGCLEDGGEGVSIPSIHHRNNFENSRNLLHIDVYFFWNWPPYRNFCETPMSV